MYDYEKHMNACIYYCIWHFFLNSWPNLKFLKHFVNKIQAEYPCPIQVLWEIKSLKDTLNVFIVEDDLSEKDKLFQNLATSIKMALSPVNSCRLGCISSP